MTMFGGFFEGKKILVTGVAGVKGSWLALALLEAGGEVIGLDIKSPEADSNFSAAGLGEKISFVQGDVTDLSLLQNLMRGVDGVFHLAALALVGDARQRPLETYCANTLGTAAVLEAIRLSDSVKYAVFVTTDKVYKSKGDEVWVETDPLVATGPYPVSKACAEYIIADYYRSYLRPAGKRIGVGRAGNVIIGGDFNSSRRTGGAGRIFVDCVEALMEGLAPEIFTPKFTRPYTYGLDILAGYMSLMSQLDCEDVDGEAFNFGPHEQYGIENALLASEICELWGNGVTWQSGTPRDEPFEKQSLSWEKARERLGWQPAYTLSEALRATVRWYREWAERGKAAGEGGMYEFNRALIAEHLAAVHELGVA
ncbi:MAG: GDP-mannose 4,6-dehydratase [Acidobacteria bacterium]|nr:GDP-mannose 4,6-dehydratase [Acidobacteriota bacterium]